MWSITATIASEYSFLLYSYENDFFNLMGHYFKVVSFYLIYKAIIVTCISALYDKVSNELKEKKRALRMYKKLFNSIDECFCIIDVVYDSNRKPVNYQFIEVNPAFEKETKLENTVGKFVSQLIPQFDKNILKIFGAVISTGKPVRFIYQIASLDSWYNIYTFKIDQENDSRIAVLFRNINEEVNERNEIERNIRMQNEIFANVSHELKTPLNVIFSTVQLLEIYSSKESLNKSRHKVLRSIDIIKQNCYRFTKLINNIVDLSKMESGFIKMSLKNENIVIFVESIIISISEFIHEKELNIIFNPDIEDKVIAFDPDKIERVLLNLISNAIKFSNKDDTIYVDLTDKGQFIEISVRDTGVGIDKKHLEYIFNRFYQVDKTLSRNAEGTGIGLSLVKSIIEMHGGKIKVKSSVGYGSTFTFSLPAKTIEDLSCEEPKHNISNNVEILNVEFSDIYNL